MLAICIVCYYHNEVYDDDRDLVCENGGIALMGYEDGSMELMREEAL